MPVWIVQIFSLCLKFDILKSSKFTLLSWVLQSALVWLCRMTKFDKLGFMNFVRLWQPKYSTFRMDFHPVNGVQLLWVITLTWKALHISCLPDYQSTFAQNFLSLTAHRDRSKHDYTTIWLDCHLNNLVLFIPRCLSVEKLTFSSASSAA